jgi:hypothetical protein
MVAALAVTFAVFCAGCGDAERIRSYTVAKEAAPAAATASAPAAAETGEATDRMLVAILPAGGQNQAWFFKVVGPLAVVDQRAEEITNFFAGIRFDESGRARWTLPSGWKEDPPREMRAATFWVPTQDKPLEISVTTLPWRGTTEELVSNVNRWRGQLQLPPIESSGLAETTRELDAGGAKLTLVDLRGRFQGSGMAAPFAPFAGGAGGPGRGAPNAADQLPAGHPPIDVSGGSPHGTRPGAASDADLPTFTAPSSWQQRKPSSTMRKAEFALADGDKQAVVTLIDFPANAGPMIADPLENVNMWRQDLGLGRIEKAALAEVVESIEIDGKPAHVTRLIADASEPAQSPADRATLAAMVTVGDRVWFVKMTGSRELVAAQEDAFKSFLKSFRFPADGGANDGN